MDVLACQYVDAVELAQLEASADGRSHGLQRSRPDRGRDHICRGYRSDYRVFVCGIEDAIHGNVSVTGTGLDSIRRIILQHLDNGRVGINERELIATVGQHLPNEPASDVPGAEDGCPHSGLSPANVR